jgi:DNA-binding response OmpR family regulator
MKLLLVEDNANDANLIQDIIKLKFLAVTISHCTSLTDAIQRLENENFDLVILDLGLPDSEGITTLLEAQKVCEGPIVILTGNDSEELGAEAVGAGAQDYIIKGVDPKHLCSRVKFAIKRNLRNTIKSDYRKPKKHFTQAISKLTNIIDTLNQSSNPSS